MDFVETFLTSSDANNFFGTVNWLCRSKILEATLRYVAIKSSGGDIEKVKLIKTKELQADYDDNGNRYTNENYDGTELLIITPHNRGDSLLSINSDGWISLDSPPYPVAALLSAKSSETRIYVNNEKKRVIIFVRTPTENWCELLASCLFRVLPWRFNDNKEAIALAQAIAKNNPDEFRNIIDGCCKNFDFKDIVAKRTLIGWASGMRLSRLEALKKEMESLLSNISFKEAEIASFLAQYNMANTNYLALQKIDDLNDDTFYNFFTNHKQLSIYRVSNQFTGSSGRTLDYCVLETIEYYDEDNFMNNYNTPHSDIGSSGDEMKRILYGIFKEHKGVIRAEAVFRLTDLSSLTVMRAVRTGKHDKEYLAHPHLVNYGCLGENEAIINRYMMSGDWDLAIEQSIAAVKNINMGDSTVVRSMIRDLNGGMDSCCCIVADNGQAMTPRQFLSYLQHDAGPVNTEQQ